MTSQPGEQIIAIHILSNISRSRGNQRMKFVRLIEYSLRNILIETLTWGTFSWKIIHKIWWKNYSQVLYYKIIIEHILINSRKFYTVYFSYIPNWWLSNYIETQLKTICFYLIWIFFKKETGLELVFLPHFFFFLSGFSFTNNHESQDYRGRGRAFL